MELTNHVELNFSPHFPVVLLFANAQSATWANPKWRLPAELPVIHATTPLPYKNLDGYGCSLRAGLNFRPYRLKSDLDFGVDNFWTVRRLLKFSSSPSGSVSTQQLNARIYNRSEIRPVPCECSLIFVHTDKTLVSNTMNGFFFPKGSARKNQRLQVTWTVQENIISLSQNLTVDWYHICVAHAYCERQPYCVYCCFVRLLA